VGRDWMYLFDFEGGVSLSVRAIVGSKVGWVGS
jgi:hypothetical protein